MYDNILMLITFIGERAKRARRYLVMFMETRDIYVRLFLIPMRAFSLGYPDPPSVLAARVSVLRIKFKS